MWRSTNASRYHEPRDAVLCCSDTLKGNGEAFMAILKFLDTRELEEFATGLAVDLGRRFPPASEARTDPGAQHQIRVILEGLAARAVRYRQEHKLGIYKKAKLGNVFRWKLRSLATAQHSPSAPPRKSSPGSPSGSRVGSDCNRETR